MKSETRSSAEIRPFRIAIPDSELDDLRDRLARTHGPDGLPGAGWEYGVPLDYLRELIDYRRSDYDWRTHEARLNQFPSSPRLSTVRTALPARPFARVRLDKSLKAAKRNHHSKADVGA